MIQAEGSSGLCLDSFRGGREEAVFTACDAVRSLFDVLQVGESTQHLRIVSRSKVKLCLSAPLGPLGGMD